MALFMPAVRDSLYTAGAEALALPFWPKKSATRLTEQGYDLERLAGLCRHHNLTTIHPRNNMMIQANEMVQKKFFH